MGVEMATVGLGGSLAMSQGGDGRPRAPESGRLWPLPQLPASLGFRKCRLQLLGASVPCPGATGPGGPAGPMRTPGLLSLAHSHPQPGAQGWDVERGRETEALSQGVPHLSQAREGGQSRGWAQGLTPAAPALRPRTWPGLLLWARGPSSSALVPQPDMPRTALCSTGASRSCKR